MWLLIFQYHTLLDTTHPSPPPTVQSPTISERSRRSQAILGHVTQPPLDDNIM